MLVYWDIHVFLNLCSVTCLLCGVGRDADVSVFVYAS